MKKMMDSREGQKAMKDALDDATNTCRNMDGNISNEDQEEMYKSAGTGGAEAGKLGSDYIKEIAASLQKINMSMGPLKERIKKIMDKSASYFSAKKERIFEDFFNSDNISNLDEFYNLHPKLRKFMIEDIQIPDTKNIGKINLYIDISGSMDGNCGTRNSEGNSILKIDFAKGFAAKLLSLDMLNKLYLFNTSVKERKSNMISIATIGTAGGTSINTVIRHIKKEQTNALIITDAEDNCSEYTELAYFVGVAGARFSSFNLETMHKYAEKDQAIMFDGNRIQRVTSSGQLV